MSVIDMALATHRLSPSQYQLAGIDGPQPGPATATDIVH